MQNPQSSGNGSHAEISDPTGTADARGSATGDEPRITQDGEERIFQDAVLEIVNS